MANQNGGLSRQQIRMMERRTKRLQELRDNLTQAKVVAFVVGYDHSQLTETDPVGMLGNVGADILCSCGTIFRYTEIPAPSFSRDLGKTGKDEEAPATTGPWMEGRCPSCNRGHRVRVTVAVIVEEEALDEEKAILREARGDTGLILPEERGIIPPS